MDVDWSRNDLVFAENRNFSLLLFSFLTLAISTVSEFRTWVRKLLSFPTKLHRPSRLALRLSRSLRKSRHVDYEVRCAARYLVGIYVCHDSLLLGSQLIRIRLEPTTGNNRELSLKHTTLPNIKFSTLNFTTPLSGEVVMRFQTIANFYVKS